MNKLKLLLAACAFTAGTAATWAGNWTSGAEIADGEYYLYNVGADRFLNRGSSWTTHAVADGTGMVTTLANVSEGVYTIYTGMGSGYLQTVWMDQGAYNWTFEPVMVDGLTNAYTIKNDAVGYLYFAGGKGQWASEVLNSTTITSGSENNFYWLLIPKTTREDLSSATIENPAEITYKIKNSDFEYEKLNSWTNSTGYQQQTSNQDFASGIFGEKWNSSGITVASSLSQTITLDEGVYRLTATTNSGHSQFYIYGGDKETQISAAGLNEVFFHVDADGTATEIGVKTKDGGTGNWIAFDNFRLYYYGNVSLNDVINATLIKDFNEQKTMAEAIDQTAPMTASVLTALQTAITDYAGLNTATATTEELQTAVSALKTANNDAQTNIENYAKTAKAIIDAKALKEAHNFATAAATTTFADAIAAIEASYTDRSLSATDAADAPYTLGTAVSGWRANANGAAVKYLNNGFSLADGSFGTVYVNTWSTEGDTDGTNFTVPFYEYWTGNGNSLGEYTFTGSLSDLPNGLYTVSAWVRVRAKDGVTATDATGITMDVNNGDATDVTTGTQIGDTQFTISTFSAQGLVKDGNLKVNFNIAAGNNISWLSIKNVKYTKLRDLTAEEEIVVATAEDLAALNAAISAAEAKTIGFQAGEYAPYNNIAGVAALKAAKAIDQTNEYLAQEDVQAATTSLTTVAWSENTEEMNAVNDGTFAAAENNGAPAGWRMSNNTLGGDYHSRAFVGDDRLAEFNSTKSGLFLRFDGTNSSRGSMYFYGDTEGYEMPLKADTYYRVTVDFAGWGSTGKPLRMNVTGPEGFTALTQQYNTSVRADNADNAPQQFNIVFKTAGAGNYVINFQTPGADTNTHNVIVSNVVLKTAAPETIEVTDAGYATYVSDNALNFEGIEGLTAYKATVEGTTVTFTKVTTVPAGEGVLLKGAGNYSVPQAVAAAWAESDNAFVRGTGEAVATVADGKYNYILSKNAGVVGFYQAAGKTVATDRAYLQSTESAARLSFRFDDETTGISAAKAGQSNGAIYNLNGQRVENAQKGLYIRDGKKVVIK